MLRLNEFQIYELAIHIHPLTQINPELRYSQIWFDWFQARSALEALFQQRALEVCLAAAKELYAAIESVVPKDFAQAIAKIPAKTETEPSIGWVANRVKSAAEKFETIISAELSNSDTYWISPKGTHKTSMLLQYAHMELPPPVLVVVPEVKLDFDEAGKCLLFDTATAAGFHLLRATETVIRKYYKLVTGTEPKMKFRNWGAYVRALKSSPTANQKVIHSIDHIRELYRNPILHPEDNLSIEDAQVLFGICVSAITLIVADMKAIEEKSEAPLHPLEISAAG